MKSSKLLFTLHALIQKVKKNWGNFLGAFIVQSILILILSVEMILSMFPKLLFAFFIILCFIGLCYIIDIPLEKYTTRRRDIVLFATTIADNVDKLIEPFSKVGIAWGTCITLQKSPNLQEGWSFKEVEIEFERTIYPFEKKLEEKYNQFMNNNSGEFKDDGDKLMLTINPKAFDEAKTLTLKGQLTKYSRIIFFIEEVINDVAERNKYINSLFLTKDDIEFPHSLCIHAVITTKDKKVLFVKRSPKVIYYPNKWAVSCEESAQSTDLDNKNPILFWAKRLLKEELGVDENDYSEENLRLLSVFLESEILNITLCMILKLNISSFLLDNILKSHKKLDDEFIEWKFLTYQEAAALLLKPTINFHPTTQYRIYMSLLHLWGFDKLKTYIIKLKKKVTIKIAD